METHQDDDHPERLSTQARPSVGSMLGVTIALVPVAGFVGFTVYQLLHLQASGTRFMGVGLLAIGTLNILGRRQIGQQMLRPSKFSPPFFSGFWESLGENRIQTLYLGIGIIFAVAGCVLVIMGPT